MPDMNAPASIQIAELISRTEYGRLPKEVIDYSKILALSALGATVAGSALPTSNVVRKYVHRVGGSAEATVAMAGFKASVEYAAMANGFFAHVTEYEDDSMPEGVSAYTLFPPLLALGEKLGLGGTAILEAFVAGQEVQSRFGLDCANARKRGYLNLCLVGVLGVAASAAKLLRLDVDRQPTHSAYVADRAYRAVFKHVEDAFE